MHLSQMLLPPRGYQFCMPPSSLGGTCFGWVGSPGDGRVLGETGAVGHDPPLLAMSAAAAPGDGAIGMSASAVPSPEGGRRLRALTAAAAGLRPAPTDV